VNYTLYRVTEVRCSPIPGVCEHVVWSTGDDLSPVRTDWHVLDFAALLVSRMHNENSDVGRVEWDQCGEHYLLRRQK
jgi:hypothetical protein